MQTPVVWSISHGGRGLSRARSNWLHAVAVTPPRIGEDLNLKSNLTLTYALPESIIMETKCSSYFLSLVMKSYGVSIQIKAVEQYFYVVPYLF